MWSGYTGQHICTELWSFLYCFEAAPVTTQPSCYCIWSAPCTQHWSLVVWSIVESSHPHHLPPNPTLMELVALYFHVSPYMTSLVYCTPYMPASVVECYISVDYRNKQTLAYLIHMAECRCMFVHVANIQEFVHETWCYRPPRDNAIFYNGDTALVKGLYSEIDPWSSSKPSVIGR